MSSLQKHAQTVVMERTPYKNKLFVTYAVKAAFDRDETVPQTILTAVHQAVEEYTQQQTHALRGGALDQAASALRAPPSVLNAPRVSQDGWKQRLAEAIELVVEQEHKEALEGGGSESEAEPVPKRQPFSAAELRALRAGVKIHGKSSWSKILHDERLSFAAHRTPAALQNKWRTLNKK